MSAAPAQVQSERSVDSGRKRGRAALRRWWTTERELISRDWGRLTHWFLRHRGLLDALVSVVGVVAIGLTGLVLEDFFQLVDEDSGQRPEPVFDMQRIAWWLLSIVTLLSGVWYRSRLAHAKWTLYYVRFLREWMSDWHIHEERLRRLTHLDERVVSLHMAAPAIDGVIDTAADVEQIADALQQAMNEDDIGTGYTVAPNLLWPAAVALGYQVHVWPETKLLDLTATGALEWEIAGTLPSGGRRHDFAIPERRTEPQEAPPSAGTLLLTVDLTGAGASTPPSGLRPDVRTRVAVFSAPGGLNDPNDKVAISTSVRARDDLRTVHPITATSEVISAIRDALCRHPQAVVYAVLRVPKTVALAIGSGLSGAGENPLGDRCTTCVTSACRYPWRRLVLLLHDQDRPRSEGTQYLAMRVSAGQPPAAEIAGRARRHGLVLSGAPVTAAPAATQVGATP